MNLIPDSERTYEKSPQSIQSVWLTIQHQFESINAAFALFRGQFETIGAISRQNFLPLRRDGSHLCKSLMQLCSLRPTVRKGEMIKFDCGGLLSWRRVHSCVSLKACIHLVPGIHSLPERITEHVPVSVEGLMATVV